MTSHKSRVIFRVAWITAIAAFAFKAFTFTNAGLAVAFRTRILPHNLLEASAFLFLICIAEAAFVYLQQPRSTP